MRNDVKKIDSKIKLSIIVPVYNNGAFLKDTLESIRRQSFRDYEVIVINDGSMDNSGVIIDSFVQADPRFHKLEQQNQGVSAARNAGLKAARGEFIAFVDGDDLLPKEALQAMYNVQRNHLHCDLIIGGIERVDGFTKTVNKRTKKLAEKRTIAKDDLDLVHGLSLCNKWFRKEMIDANQLSLEPFRHLEDGVFLYHFLQFADYIRACPETVYTYCKRIPAVGSSATQTVKKGMLEDAIKAYQRIQALTTEYSQAFQQELAYRILNATLIGDYYRRIWLLDDSSTALLMEQIGILWNSITVNQQRKLMKMGADLWPEQGFRDKEAIAVRPLISIFITEDVGQKGISALFKSIYGQATSNFEVIAPGAISEKIPAIYRGMPNLRFVEGSGSQAEFLNKALAEGRGEWIQIVDHACVYEHDMIRMAYRELQKGQSDCISIKMAGLEGQNPVSLKLMEIPFNQERAADSYGAEDKLDSFFVNKMIGKGFLEQSGFQFGGSLAEDGERLFEQAAYRRIDSTRLFFLGTEEELLNHGNGLPRELENKCRQMLVGKKPSFISRARRRISRMLGKTKNQSQKTSAAPGILDYYFNEPIQKQSILLEGLGKQAKGSMLYLIKELSKPEYQSFQVYLSVTKENKGEVRAFLTSKGYDRVNLVVAGSGTYRKVLSKAEYLVNEVYFPNYWIKKDGQTYINIWHGTPLKKLGAGKAGGTIHNDGTAQKNFISADYLLFANHFTKKHLLEDCYVDDLVKGKALMLGYPRTGAMLDENKRREVRKELAPYDEKIMAFMPTYRGEEQQQEQMREIKELLDSLDKQLSEKQLVYVNLHHKMEGGIEYGRYRHIRRFPSVLDTYEVLCAADCLCTDYSSLMFDFAVTGRKIILYCPDLEEYQAARGIYLDMKELPFPKTKNCSELMEEFHTDKNYDDSKFLQTFCSYDDAANAERFCRSMFLNDFRDVQIEELDTRKKDLILLYSDGWSPGLATECMYEMAESGSLKDHVYLSYKDSQVNANLDSAYPLLCYFRSVGTKGKQLFTGEQKQIYRRYRNGTIEFAAAMQELQPAYVAEQKRIYDRAGFSTMILYDTIDADKILAICNFTCCRKYLFLQEALVCLLEEQNQYIKDAVAYFCENGDGICTLSESLAHRGGAYVTKPITVLPGVGDLEQFLSECLKHDW